MQDHVAWRGEVQLIGESATGLDRVQTCGERRCGTGCCSDVAGVVPQLSRELGDPELEVVHRFHVDGTVLRDVQREVQSAGRRYVMSWSRGLDWSWLPSWLSISYTLQPERLGEKLRRQN